MTEDRQFRLAARPEGEIKDSDFELVTESVPEPGEKQFVAEMTHISVDPAARGWMRPRALTCRPSSSAM
jgi:NADPH-dependent curcumin reductase CurA